MKRFAILWMLVAVILSLFSAPAQAFKDPDPKMTLPGWITGGASASARVGTVPTIRDPDDNTKFDLYRWGTAHHNDGSTGNDEWWITGTVHYTWVDPLGERPYVVPQFAIGHYNQEGTHMGCNDLSPNELIWVKVNFYMWDRHGHNWNPGPIYLPCKEDTTATKIQDYAGKDVPRLHWVVDDRGHIHAPTWKFTWHIIKFNGKFQGSGTVQGKFRPCSGERYEHCGPL